MYRCPTCKSNEYLEVVVQTWAKLIQDENDPDHLETDADEAELGSGHEWTRNSRMTCTNHDCKACYDTHIAEFFEEEEAE